MDKEKFLALVEKYNSRSLLFALFVFCAAFYLVDEKKISGDNFAQITMWTMIMYGGKRLSDNIGGK